MKNTVLWLYNQCIFLLYYSHAMTEKTKKIKFDAVEIALIRFAMMFVNISDKTTFVYQKEDELTALMVFREFKKAIKTENGVSNVLDAELEFSEPQKDLIRIRMDAMSMGVEDLDIKYRILDKMK